MTWGLLGAFIAPPLLVLMFQAILFRAFPAKGGQILTISSMVLGYPAYLAWITLLHGAPAGSLPAFLYDSALYSFSAYSYFHVFNMSETSRRVRLLGYLAVHGSVPEADFVRLFDERAMTQVRLERLVELGQAKKVGDRYFSKGRLFPITARVLYAIGILLHRPWPAMRAFRQSSARR